MLFAIVMVVLGAMVTVLGFRLAGTSSYLTRTPRRGFVSGTGNSKRASPDDDTNERSIGRLLKLVGAVFIVCGIGLLVEAFLSNV